MSREHRGGDPLPPQPRMCALPRRVPSWTFAPGPDPPQPFNLLHHDPWRARRTCCSAPTWVPSSPSARCLGLTPRLRDPQFGRRIRSETICFKNPMKRTLAPSLSPKRSVARTQQPRPCGPQYTRRGPRERQILGRQWHPFQRPIYPPASPSNPPLLTRIVPSSCPKLPAAQNRHPFPSLSLL